MDVSKVSDLERNIERIKRDLSNLSEERWRAALSKDEKKVFTTRVKAAEKALDNCIAIADYVSNFSAPTAREIRRRGTIAQKSLQTIKASGNPTMLHSWVKEQLIPSTKLAERMAHMAASTTRTVRGQSAEFHKWQLK